MAKVGSSAKLGVQNSRHLCSIIWGVHLPKCVCLPSVVYCHSRHPCSIWRGPLAKVGLPAKFGVAVFKASILDSLGGPSAKVGSSAKFGVVVFKTSILNYLEGVHLPKYVHLPSFVYW